MTGVLMADAHDIFAADILYYKKYFSSYLTQIRKTIYSQEETKILNERKECEVYVMKSFSELFRKKVFIDRNAHLMVELIQDIQEVSHENGLQDATIKHSHLLKKGLSKNLGILLDFILLAKNRLFPAVKLIHVNTLWLH